MRLEKSKILRIITLAAYLQVLALIALHTHSHNDYGEDIVDAPKSNESKTIDPFASSNAVCSVQVFSQTSYINSHIYSLTDKLDKLHQQIVISDHNFVGIHYYFSKRLRAPPIA